jgi:hypothetical protein
MRTNMPKTTYLIELAVDEGWFKAISDFTADVHEGELCEWVRVQAETETDDQDCDNCQEAPKQDPEGEFCTACIEELGDDE